MTHPKTSGFWAGHGGLGAKTPDFLNHKSGHSTQELFSSPLVSHSLVFSFNNKMT